MNRILSVVMAGTFSLIAAMSPARAENLVYLTSLDWPPYTISSEPHGATEEVVRQAFKAAGYTLVVDYLPWNRAVTNAKTDPKYVGYFPEYYSKEAEADFVFSRPVGVGPLGFAERKADPVSWSSLDDLKETVIGTVSGYVNTDDFDNRVKDGRLKVDEARTDALNLRKLDAGRIRLAVIDKNVMEHLLKAEIDLASAAASLQFNGKMLENKDLFICFRNDAKGQEMAKIFNEGLAKIDPATIMTAYFNTSGTRK